MARIAYSQKRWYLYASAGFLIWPILFQFWMIVRLEEITDRLLLEMPAITNSNPTSTILIMRAIGNALPPRHEMNQTLSNLEFTLKHEEKFPNSARHWFLNRLVDADVEQKVVNLLREYGESYTVIPFDIDHYRQVPYRFDRISSYEGIAEHGDHQDHEKIVYTINVNGVRNAMLEYGERDYAAEFILPWDGNCFLTKDSWDAIIGGLRNQTGHNYFVVPMDRLKEPNEVLLQSGYKPVSVEEPQIIFRRGAQARFNPNLRYGRRNKVELLDRLGRFPNMPKWSSWEQRYLDSWNSKNPIEDMHPSEKVPSIGWVSRLWSGASSSESDNRVRLRTRTEGVINLLARLDQRALIEEHNQGAMSRPLLFNGTLLSHLKEIHPFKANDTPSDLKFLKKRADASLHLDTKTAPSNSGNTMASPSDLLDRISSLVLMYTITGEKVYSDQAKALLKYWFMEPETRLSFKFAKKTEPILLAYQLHRLPWFLDTIKLMAPLLTTEEQTKLDTFFRHLRIWMEKGRANEAATLDQTTGLLYDTELIALNLYGNATEKVAIMVDRVSSRWKKHNSSSENCPDNQSCDTVTLASWSTFHILSNRLLGRGVEPNLAAFSSTVELDEVTSLYLNLAYSDSMVQD